MKRYSAIGFFAILLLLAACNAQTTASEKDNSKFTSIFGREQAGSQDIPATPTFSPDVIPPTPTDMPAPSSTSVSGDLIPTPSSPPPVGTPLWTVYTNETFGVSLEMPSTWVEEAGYDARMSGADGFMQFNAVGVDNPDEPIIERCRSEASHRLMPYGSTPQIKTLSVQGQPACLIVPSPDQSMPGQHALIVKYPQQPFVINGYGYNFLMIYADGGHIQSFAATLKFIGFDASQAQPALYSFQADRQELLPGETVTLSWEGAGVHASLCQYTDTGVEVTCWGGLQPTDSEAVPISESAPVNYYVFTLTVFNLGNTRYDSASATVRLACSAEWFFDTPPPGVCPGFSAQVIDATAQVFSGGLIVRNNAVELGSGYHVFFSHSNEYLFVPHAYVIETAGYPLPPAGLTAPDGYVIPQGDIARVWYHFRNELGWAWAPAQDYDASYQCERGAFTEYYPDSTCYLLGPDGAVYAFQPSSDRSTFTIQQWPENADAAPEIVSFSVKPRAAVPGQAVAISWDARGYKFILCRLNEAQVFTSDCWRLDNSGEFSFTLGDDVQKYTYFHLRVEGNGSPVSQQVGVAVCDHAWEIPGTDPAVCPESSASVIDGVFQPFEGGMMLWREDTGRIFVFHDTGNLQDFVDIWVTGMPEEDPSITPPAGLYEPVRGFGLIWRDEPGVRQSLGWATEPEYALSFDMQCSKPDPAKPSAAFCLIGLPDGRIVRAGLMSWSEAS